RPREAPRGWGSWSTRYGNDASGDGNNLPWILPTVNASGRAAPSGGQRWRDGGRAGQRLAQSFQIDVTLQTSAVGQRDLCGLLADDDDERIGLLREAERGPVPRAETLVSDRELRQRQDH